MASKTISAAEEEMKLRAVQDFDPNKMSSKDKVQLKFVLRSKRLMLNLFDEVELDEDNENAHYFPKFNIRAPWKTAAFYSLVPAFKRGDTMRTTPPSNIGDAVGWWMVRKLETGGIGFIPRNRVVIEADYQPPSKTKLSELPLELLDAVLEKSLLHWILHSSTQQGDGDIIRALTSVDFCFLQRITKKKFKKRIWKQLKAFYGKSRKNSAIIRNNRNYLLANIKLDSTLIDSLLSSKCITEGQSLLLESLSSNRHRNIELLWAIKSVDVAKFSNVVTCLRQANQKTVARIMENGGVVAKVEVQIHGANCTTYKETQQLFHQNIEDRRNRIKPWSHKTEELISRLKDEGIEILNSHLDRQIVVVWIWCRSQTGLHYIQRLYKSNQLRDVLYGVADIDTSPPEIEQWNVINIEDNQFKKTIVVCPISINFTQRIDLGEYDYVVGITKLRNEIYIMVRLSFSTNASELSVFEDKIPFRLKKKFNMNQFESPVDMESCEKESCLYVFDYSGECVWKIAIETEKQHETIKWLTFDYYSRRMSVTSNGELLIINRKSSSSILMIYGSDATLLRSIQLPKHIKNLCCAVKTSIGNFVITNEEDEEDEEEDEEEEEEKEEEEEEEEEEKEEEDDADEEKEGETGSRQRKHEKQITYFLRELTSDGQTIIRRLIPSNETQQLKYPCYFSIDLDDQVFVADNDRVILLDSDLKWKCILPPTKDEEERMIFSPWRLCYDEEKKQLIVGCNGAGGTNVYTLSRN